MRRKHDNTGLIIGAVVSLAAVGAAACGIYKLISSRKQNMQCHYEDEQIKVINSAEKALLNKIGVTFEELKQAKLINKSAYDLALDKGFSTEQLKNFINQDRFVAIDELVLNRKISREIGEQVKEKIKEHTDKWDGSLC